MGISVYRGWNGEGVQVEFATDATQETLVRAVPLFDYVGIITIVELWDTKVSDVSLLSALTALKALYLTATKVTREQVNRLKKALAAAGNTEVEVEF